MKHYSQIILVVAAVIAAFRNQFVITEEGDEINVGHDWLTSHNPVAGDYIVTMGGGTYDLVRAVDAVDWEEYEPGIEQFVVTDGGVWINPKGGKTKKLVNARGFPSEDAARESFADGELPDGFSIVKLDTPA